MSQDDSPVGQHIAPATEAQESDERLDYLWLQRSGLVHRVWLSSLYHSKRERFYDNADKAAKAFAAIGGAAAVASLLADPDTRLFSAAAVSVVSTLSLVFSPAQKARKHAELARDFKKLWAKIEELGPYLTDKEVASFNAQILLLESSEPASMSALVRRCENQISVAMGQRADVVPLSFKEWLLMHVWDFQTPSQKPSEGPGTARTDPRD